MHPAPLMASGLFISHKEITMKKLARWLMLLSLPLLLASCSTMGARLVQMPDDARNLILVLVTAGLTALFAFLFNKWGLDLRGFVPELAAVLAAVLVSIFEYLFGLLSFIPDQILLTIIHLIVLAAAGYGTAWVLNKVRTPGFRSLH
jgi:hypothetical protein